MSDTEKNSSTQQSEAEHQAQSSVVIQHTDVLSQSLIRFADTFEHSARRWEHFIYPSLLAFVILAAYGFYLIYKMTNHLDEITQRMDAIAVNMINIGEYMSSMVDSTQGMRKDIRTLTVDIHTMQGNIMLQQLAMAEIVTNFKTMNKSIVDMNVAMYGMRRDTATMGRNMNNVARPMNFMNNFVPW